MTIEFYIHTLNNIDSCIQLISDMANFIKSDKELVEKFEKFVAHRNPKSNLYNADFCTAYLNEYKSTILNIEVDKEKE